MNENILKEILTEICKEEIADSANFRHSSRQDVIDML